MGLRASNLAVSQVMVRGFWVRVRADNLASICRRVKVEVRALIAPLPGRGHIRVLDACVVRRAIDGRVSGGCQKNEEGKKRGVLECHLVVVVHCDCVF